MLEAIHLLMSIMLHSRFTQVRCDNIIIMYIMSIILIKNVDNISHITIPYMTVSYMVVPYVTVP